MHWQTIMYPININPTVVNFTNRVFFLCWYHIDMQNKRIYEGFILSWAQRRYQQYCDVWLQ